MRPADRADDVVVIGGGIIGLAVGWKAAAAGLRVSVCDPAPGHGASWAAAGMLAPIAEASVQEAPMVTLGQCSLGLWPDFADGLSGESGIDVGLRREGGLQLAFSDDDQRVIAETLEIHQMLGLESEWCSSRACRRLEPFVSPRVRGGLLVNGDWQVDPRLVVAALVEALARRGGRLRRASVSRVVIDADTGGADGVVLEDGTTIACGAVVVAAGAHSATVAGLPLVAVPPIRPVKGEIIRLQAAPAGPPFERVISASVYGRRLYLVPRTHGEIVVGATMQEAGFDTTVRAGAVHDLLHDAAEVVPALAELPFTEAIAGLRPTTPDNAPVIGPTPVPDLFLATGHFRHGVLLAPFTAEAVVAALLGKDVPVEAAAFGVERFR
jgi:glycine oxidase